MLEKEVLNFLLPVETEVRGTPTRDRYPDDSRGSRQSRCSVGGKQSFPEVGQTSAVWALEERLESTDAWLPLHELFA